jgi:WD40 repeat protein
MPQRLLSALLHYLSGQPVVSIEVAALIKGASQRSLLMRWTLAAAVLLALVALPSDAAMWVHPTFRSPVVAEQAPPDPQAKAEEKPAKRAEKKPRTDLYGDPLPPGALHRLGSLRFRHGSEINAVVFSPDCKTLVVGCDDCIVLWDSNTGGELRRIPVQRGANALAMTTDGKVLASVSRYQKPIHLWDISTGKQLLIIESEHAVEKSLVFSSDGRLLAGDGAAGTVPVWDTTTGKVVRELKTGRKELVFGVAFSPDGKSLAAGGQEGTIRVWDVATGEKRHEFKARDYVLSVAYAPDGKSLVSGDGAGCVLMWELPSGKLRREIEHPTGFRAFGMRILQVVFFPDGQTLASVNGFGICCLWESATGKQLWKQRHFRCNGISATPQGKTLAVAGDKVVRLWDMTTQKQRAPVFDGLSSISPVVCSPDDRILAAGGEDHTIRLWDVKTGILKVQLHGHSEPIRFLAFSPDGQLLTSLGQDGTFLWDIATGRQLHRVPGKVLLRPAALSPDGKIVALRNRQPEEVTLVETATGKELQKLPNTFPGPFQWFTFLADSKSFVLCCSLGVRVWDVGTGKSKNEFKPLLENAALNSFAVSPNGKLLAVYGNDGILRLCDIATGKQYLAWNCSGERACHALAFSPDGRLLASGSWGGKIHVWEVATGKERRSFPGHRGQVHTLAFSPDGKTLISGSADSTILLWDMFAPTDQPPSEKLAAERLEALWTNLSSADAGLVHETIVTMLNAPQALGLLRQRLQFIPRPDQANIERLIANLNSDEFATRQQASSELEKLGDLAVPFLTAALKTRPGLEVRLRIEQILAKAEHRVSSSEDLQTWRALEVLEHIGTPDAKQVVEKLAQGAPGHRITEEAKASLERLRKRPALP